MTPTTPDLFTVYKRVTCILSLLRSTTSSFVFVTLSCRWFSSHHVTKSFTVALYSSSSPLLIHPTSGESSENFWRWQVDLQDRCRLHPKKDELAKWAAEHHITHNAVNALLSVLGKHHPTLPRDARTLLGTVRSDSPSTDEASGVGGKCFL
ncbi:uncharacterized protein LOC143521500 isoform X2 [Brachyhypopomus gauderio]|uniref:uncharacterized protein LOC143521486 isoform X2 n=1 Tax=Brachyhypopomus gauderio TaxID=698409 RepID=UPI0040428204